MNCTDDNRISWDEQWMTFAYLISRRSHDDITKVGAVIVAEDNSVVLSVGYNGNCAGAPHERASSEPGKSNFIHAEVNALLKFDFNFHKKKKLYVTVSPCLMCGKLIKNAGIDDVIFGEEYRDTSGISLLRDLSVSVKNIRELLSEHRFGEFKKLISAVMCDSSI